MSNILLLLKFLPQMIDIFKKIKLMVKDGIDEQEIKQALSNIEKALSHEDINVAESELNRVWNKEVAGQQSDDGSQDQT